MSARGRVRSEGGGGGKEEVPHSAAEAALRDADVAANLTKAQVLQQTSLAALSQANSAPQAVLSLLKNLG